MIVGNYEDDKEYKIVAMIMVEGGLNSAISDSNVPGFLVKKAGISNGRHSGLFSNKENVNL